MRDKRRSDRSADLTSIFRDHAAISCELDGLVSACLEHAIRWIVDVFDRFGRVLEDLIQHGPADHVIYGLELSQISLNVADHRFLTALITNTNGFVLCRR
jgi:hypothetical protein